MGTFLRNLGGAAGGVAKGIPEGAQLGLLNSQVEANKEVGDFLKTYGADGTGLPKGTEPYVPQEGGGAYKKLADYLEWARGGKKQPEQIGNRNPAAAGAAAGLAAGNPLGADPQTPMLTQSAGEAPGLGAQQPAPPTPMMTKMKAPRTLPFVYDNLGE